jgi:hypothetical protein
MLGPVGGDEFLDWLSKYQLINNNSAAFCISWSICLWDSCKVDLNQRNKVSDVYQYEIPHNFGVELHYQI